MLYEMDKILQFLNSTSVMQWKDFENSKYDIKWQ